MISKVTEYEKRTLTSTHWGTYRVESENGVPSALYPFEEDPQPSPTGDSMLETLSGPCRIDAPAVRRIFLVQPFTYNSLGFSSCDL